MNDAGPRTRLAAQRNKLRHSMSASESDTDETSALKSEPGLSPGNNVRNPSKAQLPAAKRQQPGSGYSDGPCVDRASWKGWAELENDPLIFNTLLREWGVQRVEVQEVIPLDTIFDASADSTYGLVLLSRYVPSTPTTQTKELPPQLWFANQTSSFSCATVTLMNIINNRADIDLGLRLLEFRADTCHLSPKDRGHALDNFKHVRDVHNSFASDIDLMNVDLRLKEDATAAAKKAAAAARARGRATKGRKRKRAKLTENEEEDDEDDNGFHFIAYAPACGHVWRMDGMERRAFDLGELSSDTSWLALVLPDVQAQWTNNSSNGLEFSLLRLVESKGKNEQELMEEKTRVIRMREDWTPFIKRMVLLHAERGDLKEMLG